ncbi:hypothetical protein C8R45DRAFT_1111734 [Mycena sanguinolenta]|nr:hypothetical protein C8R45DRAFT_1111734 [Mycena sanguinolenta]
MAAFLRPHLRSRMSAYMSPRLQRSIKSTPTVSTNTTTTLPMPLPTLPSRVDDLSHRAPLHDTLALPSQLRSFWRLHSIQKTLRPFVFLIAASSAFSSGRPTHLTTASTSTSPMPPLPPPAAQRRQYAQQRHKDP